MLLYSFNKRVVRLTNTTILPRVSSDTGAVIIIHSIRANSSIFAWSISTIVDIFFLNKINREWLGIFKIFTGCGKFMYLLINSQKKSDISRDNFAVLIQKKCILRLTNTTILPGVSSDTAAVIIIQSICAVSSILAWPISTIVDIFRKRLRK